jgi:hypothetical protein
MSWDCLKRDVIGRGSRGGLRIVLAAAIFSP